MAFKRPFSSWRRFKNHKNENSRNIGTNLRHEAEIVREKFSANANAVKTQQPEKLLPPFFSVRQIASLLKVRFSFPIRRACTPGNPGTKATDKSGLKFVMC